MTTFRRVIPTLAVALGLAACTGSDAGQDGPQVEGDAIGVAGAHEHGVVRLGLAVDGTRLTLDAQAPADAIFGFEHAPATDDDRAVVRSALDRVRADAGSLISLAADLGCVADAIEITEAPDVEGAHADDDVAHDHDEDGHDHDDDAGHDHDEDGDGHDHDGDDADHGHAEDEADHDHAEDNHDHTDDAGTHSEVRFTVSWACDAEIAGSPATLQVTNLLPNAELVDLTVITGYGQAGGRVGADAGFRF